MATAIVTTMVTMATSMVAGRVGVFTWGRLEAGKLRNRRRLRDKYGLVECGQKREENTHTDISSSDINKNKEAIGERRYLSGA